MNVLWFSAGVSSFVAGYVSRGELDKILYCHILDQHPDSIRFLNACEPHLGKYIDILCSPYQSVENVCRAFSFINSRYGAKCTQILKKRVRKEWERDQTEPLTYYWGLDAGETRRVDQIMSAMPEQSHRFPLIERGLTKADCHGIAAKLGIKRPAMYDLGFNNNNCIGCVKGGMDIGTSSASCFPMFLPLGPSWSGTSDTPASRGCGWTNLILLGEMWPKKCRKTVESPVNWR